MEIFKFEPILKTTIWGGDKIIPFKKLNSNLKNVGESWEISGVPGHETKVYGGKYHNLTLNNLVSILKEKLIGKNNYMKYGDFFPILVKFIDAKQRLSIQVHPSDDNAKQLGYASGKTEMWYIMKSNPEATLICGLKNKITNLQYKQHVENHTITDVLTQYNVKEGDCFFIPPGRIHSIGAGTFLAEIQQTADITFRIYDFNRKDANGKCRELHTTQAAQCIDFNVEPDYKTHYNKQTNNCRTPLVECKHFNTSIINLKEQLELNFYNEDSFHILVVTNGNGKITWQNKSLDFNVGDSLLIPACITQLTIKGNATMLETHI